MGKFRCGEKKKRFSHALTRAHVESSMSLSLPLFVNRSRDTKGGVGVHIWMNRHTDGYVVYVTFHYLGRCLALLLYAIRYVSKRARARADTCLRILRPAQMLRIIFHVSSLACKQPGLGNLQRGPSAPRVNSALSVPSDDRPMNKFARC